MDTMNADIREEEDGLAIRIPRSWLGEDLRNVRLERHGGMIVITPRPVALEDVAQCCAEWGGGFPERLPQSVSGVRV